LELGLEALQFGYQSQRILRRWLLAQGNVFDGIGTLLPVVLPVRIVEIPEVAIRDRHRIIRDRRVPDAHPLRIDASIPPPILIQNVLLAHANGGADEIAHLLGPTLGPEVFLDLNPLLSRLRIL